jgi:chromosome segregation ATPase
MVSAEGRIGFNNERNEELEGRIRQNEEQIAANAELLDQARRDLASADEQLLAITDNIQTRQLAVNEHAGQHQNIIPERNRLESDRRAIRESIRQFEGQIASSEARAQSLSSQISADRQRTTGRRRPRCARPARSNSTSCSATSRNSKKPAINSTKRPRTAPARSSSAAASATR